MRRAGCLLIAVFATFVYAAPAGAADRAYSTAFAWQSDPTDGYAGWLFQEYDSTGPVAPGRYSGRTGGVPTYGRGLTITPTGNGGVYPDQASGRFTYRTPGASPATQVSVRKVIYSGVTQKVADRQGVRLRLGDGTSNATDDLNADGQTRTNATVTLPGTGFGPSSSEISAWMFSEPCQPTTTTTCRTVNPDNGGVNHIGGAELSLLDHEAPTITASGPAYEQRGRWVAETPASVTVQAGDPGSGVRSYTLKSTGPGGSRTVLTRTVACDLKHTDATVGSQQCPTNPGPSTRNAGAIGALPTGITTFIASSRDLAGQTSGLLRWMVKIDREPPKAPLAAKLKALNGAFLRTGQPATFEVKTSDTRSGVLRLSAQINSSRGTRTVTLSTPCTPIRTQCPHIAESKLDLDLGEEPTGITTVTLVATDLAGNSAAAKPVRLRIDKLPPAVVQVTSASAEQSARTVTWREPRDEGGSGIDHYEARVATVGPDDDASAALARQRYRTIGKKRTLRLLSATGGRETVADVVAVDKAGNSGRSSKPADTRKPKKDKRGGPAVVACDLFAYPKSFPGDVKPGRTLELGARVRSYLEQQTQLRVAVVPICSGNDFDRIERLEFTAVIKDIDQRPAWEVTPGIVGAGAGNTPVKLSARPGGTGDIGAGVGNGVNSAERPRLIQARTNGPRFRDVSTQTVVWRKGQIPQLTRSKGDVYIRAVRTFTGLCNAAAGGDHDYGVDGQLKFVLSGTSARSIRKTTENTNARLRCPTIAQRHEREAIAWKLLAEFSAVDLTDNRYRSPSTHLRRSLGAQPFTPRPKGKRTKNAWAAHHMVPVGATDPADMSGGPNEGFDGLRSLLLRCRIHPNAPRNGIYLRSFGLKRKLNGMDNPDYNRLANAKPTERDRRGNRLVDLAKRTYHGDTFADSYYGKLRAIFGGTLLADSNCSSSFGPRVNSALAQAFAKQSAGAIGVEKGN